MKKIIIYGIFGSMGQKVLEYLEHVEDVEIFGVDRTSKNNTEIISNNINDFTSDIVIDFSSPDAIYDIIDYGKRTKTPLVLCTTGYSGEQINLIHKASKHIPIFHSQSMSYGVNVLLYLTEQATKLLDNFDIEIIEKHYKDKKNTPSETSLIFARAAKTIRPLSRRYGRPRDIDNSRDDIEIGMHSVRGGTVAGEHEIGFYGNNQSVLLAHKSESIDTIAEGAMQAALYMIGKTQPGIYDMYDIVMDNLEKADIALAKHD